MKSLYYDLKKSTEHLSDAHIKHMRILLAGKDCSDSSTKDEKFVLVFLKFSLLL